MIKEHDLLEAIAECQGERNPNANTCRNLAAYYTLLDHLYPSNNIKEDYSYSAPPIYQSETEFGELLQMKDINEILPVIDELMTTLQVINPRLYAGVIRKLS